MYAILFLVFPIYKRNDGCNDDDDDDNDVRCHRLCCILLIFLLIAALRARTHICPSNSLISISFDTKIKHEKCVNRNGIFGNNVYAHNVCALFLSTHLKSIIIIIMNSSSSGTTLASRTPTTTNKKTTKPWIVFHIYPKEIMNKKTLTRIFVRCLKQNK